VRRAPLAAAAVALLAIACAQPASTRRREPSPNPPDRFDIVEVGDTTFGFAVGPRKWLRPGATGIAVDPRRRDGLVARYRVLWVKDGVVTALITGQTTRVTADHMALAVRPATPLLRQRTFWAGAFSGGLLGAIASTLSW
jgi:hypothetical protein